MKIYREIVRNVEMGVQAIKNLFEYVEDEKLRTCMFEQKSTLEEFLSQAKTQLSCDEQQQAEGSKLQKTMLKAGVTMNAMMNNDNTHVADMLIKGYRMGIDSIQKCANELKREGNQIPQLASEVMKYYDKSIKALRAYL